MVPVERRPWCGRAEGAGELGPEFTRDCRPFRGNAHAKRCTTPPQVFRSAPDAVLRVESRKPTSPERSDGGAAK